MIPILPMQRIEFVTVKQMYGLSQLRSIPLLSDYTAEFWNGYVQNYEHYDRVFNRLYRDFYYFNQDANRTAEEVQPEFTEDVYGLLLMNHKKYSELYRVNVVSDNDYSILDNYDVVETKEGENAKSITDNYGQHINSTQSQLGSQNNSATEKVSPYDTENFYNENRNDTTLGQRNDSSSTTYGSRADTHEHEGTDSYELHRRGNIGVQTQSEVMSKHVNFWKGYNFYKIVFDDICRELLLIDKGDLS